MSIYKEDESSLQLKDLADTSHDDAVAMFWCYGWHLSTEDGDFVLQIVDPKWLEAGKTEDEIAELILADEGKCVVSRDVADALADKAMRVWADMVAVEGALARAVKAYEAGDLTEVVEALREAGSLESDHGDDPSTDCLAQQLLEEKEEDGEVA